MDLFSHPEFDGHEQVIFSQNGRDGLRSIIAIHDTRLGPALGGCRIHAYADEGQALTDVLRLSRGMTNKAALADLALGGGKSVILADPARDKTPAMMRAMGRAVERLGGRYIIAEDVGATVADMDEIARETAHVSGTSGSVGDPAPWTARGVFLSVLAALDARGIPVAGARVSVTGLGAVGGRLARLLAGVGARLVVSDIRTPVAEALAAETGGKVVAPETAHRVAADVFAPCALGAGLNAVTIPELGAGIVCGAANNQLATAADDARLAERGVLYCPDYLVNAGGLISVARPVLAMGDDAAETKLSRIPETLREVIDRAADGRTGAAADALARARLDAAGA